MQNRTVTRCPRVATPERWQSALRRAIANGIEVYQIAATGEWIATSASKPGTAYITDGVTCECEAAEFGNDPVCQHRAAFWHANGGLELEPTEAELAAAEAKIAADEVAVFDLTEERRCSWCNGTGECWPEDGAFHLTPDRCWWCHGTGVDPSAAPAVAQPAVIAPVLPANVIPFRRTGPTRQPAA